MKQNLLLKQAKNQILKQRFLNTSRDSLQILNSFVNSSDIENINKESKEKIKNAVQSIQSLNMSNNKSNHNKKLEVFQSLSALSQDNISSQVSSRQNSSQAGQSLYKATLSNKSSARNYQNKSVNSAPHTLNREYSTQVSRMSNQNSTKQKFQIVKENYINNVVTNRAKIPQNQSNKHSKSLQNTDRKLINQKLASSQEKFKGKTL